MDNPIVALQYYNNGSFLNDVNPFAKFCALISLSVVLFISRSIWVHTSIFIFCLFLFLISRHSFTRLQGARLLILTTIFIGVLQVVFIQTGKVIIGIGFLRITQSGLIHAASASARFISIILLSFLFILTTETDSFVLSTVELGLPYRFGYTLMTAMRMVPMVKSEVKKISYAQVTRGVSYALFPPGIFFKNSSRFLKVILISTIKRVNQLVISMEGRGFGLSSKRTFIHTTKYRWTDYALIALSIALVPISIKWR